MESHDVPLKRVALVTGASCGIGFETCKELARQDYTVVLTSRDEAAGRQAAEALRQKGLDVVHHLLDVTDDAHVRAVKHFVSAELGRLDALVNNAGVLLDQGRRLLKVEPDVFRKTFEVNVFGALRLSQAFLPMMLGQEYGRVVNVSSGMGQLNSTMRQAGLDVMPAYRMSKAALNALTVMLASAVSGRNILVNSACPGWCRTKMGGPSAPRTAEQGAETVAWLATLPDGGPSGGFFQDRKQIAW